MALFGGFSLPPVDHGQHRQCLENQPRLIHVQVRLLLRRQVLDGEDVLARIGHLQRTILLVPRTQLLGAGRTPGGPLREAPPVSGCPRSARDPTSELPLALGLPRLQDDHRPLLRRSALRLEAGRPFPEARLLVCRDRVRRHELLLFRGPILHWLLCPRQVHSPA